MKAAFDVIRRAFYYWQFAAVFVLPAWLFVGWGVFGGSGWGFVGLLIAAPLVFISLLVIALIIYARPAVRSSKAVSWKDVGLLVVLHGSIIALGFFSDATSLFVVVAIAAAVAGFWLSIWELFTESARNMKATMSAFEQAAQAPQQPQMPTQHMPASRTKPGDDPDVIIIHEVRE